MGNKYVDTCDLHFSHGIIELLRREAEMMEHEPNQMSLIK